METLKEPTATINSLSTSEKTLKISQIKIINDTDGCKTWIPILKSHCDEVNILGFDCEWVQMGQNRNLVALLQLATHRGLCLLIRLCLMKTIPDELKEILEDENIIKVGVIPLDDAKKLQQDYNVQTKNTFDLRNLVQLARCEARGLKIMAEKYLNLKWKENYRFHALWEKPMLSDEQINYAAMDVFVAVELFKHFSEKLLPKSESEDQKAYTQSIVSKYCEKYLDKDFEKDHYSELKDIIACDPSVEIDIKIISTADECRLWMQTLKCHCKDYNVLGFQCSYSKEDQTVSALQLDTYQGLCLIIELRKLETIPVELEEILQDEKIIKVSYKSWDQVKCYLRDHNTFVTSTFELRLLVDSNISEVPLSKLCEAFLNVKFDADTNAAYVNMELFKLLAQKVQPKKDEDEKTYVQHIIQKYTSNHLDLKYIGDFHMKKAFTVIVNSLDRCSLLMPTLKLHCKEYNVLGIGWTFEERRRAKGKTKQVVNDFDSVALLHLTTHRGVCAIINLCNLKEIPGEIEEILEDDRIIKVGINPGNIGNYLLREYHVRVKSSFDVRHIAKMVGSVKGNLDQIFKSHLGRYFADNKVPSSWANEKFKDKELEYSARHSHQAVELFKFFHLKLISNDSFKDISTSTMNIVEKYIDKNYEFEYSDERPSNSLHEHRNYRQSNSRNRNNRGRKGQWNSRRDGWGGNKSRSKNRDRNRFRNKRYMKSNRHN